MTKARRHPMRKEQEQRDVFSSMPMFRQDMVCVVLLYVITILLFNEIILNNAAFSSGGDTAASLSYAHAGTSLEEQEGEDAIWMPYFFSGMPTFGNVAYVPHNVSYVQTIVVKVLNLLYLNGRWTWLVVFCFLGGVFMFMMMRGLGFAPLIALFGAAAYMMSPYAVNLAGEGHGSKLMALSYLPLVFFLTHWMFQRRDVLSLGLLVIGIGTMMLTNHMQIVYYAFLLLGCYLLYHVILDFREHKLLAASKAALFAGALLFGMLIAAYIYLSSYEYAQFSMRGGGTPGTPGGLSWDYATNWSWHPLEAITLLIPGFFGFQLPYYWGPIEPWTNSTVYVGVLPIFLAIVAVLYRREPITWFFLIVTILLFLISFGRTLPVVYQLLFALLPFFNKFRAPSMILHLLPFTIAILAAYGIAWMTRRRDQEKPASLEKIRRRTLYALGVVLAILVIGLLIKGSLAESLTGFTFLKEGEAEQFRQQYGTRAPQAIAQITQARFDIFWKDTVKFLLITAVSLAVTVAFFSRKLQLSLFTAALTLILVVDLFLVNGKLIKPSPHSDLEQSFRPDATVQFLKEQSGLFRILPLGSLFMDNTYAYHGLHSIGGYSPAKLRIYQTMLDSSLYRGPDPTFPLNMSILNMLGVKYIIAPGVLPEDRLERAFVDQAKQLLTYRNPGALPRAFFVDRAIVVAGDAEVFRELNSPAFDPARTAVLQQARPPEIFPPDSEALVRITQYTSRRITLDARTSRPSLLVLSEVYYPAGWRAFIDNVETEIYRTNSVLRSVVVPAGQHTVHFAFDPTLYTTGYTLTHVGWAAALLLLLAGLWRMPGVRAWFGGKRRAEVTHAG